jgi:peroxiredoxin family protein
MHLTMTTPIEKVSIIVSKGSFEGIYPALIMANGARMEGIEANVFFTFFGMDAVTKERMAHIKVATVGNPGLHIPTMLGGLPGMSALVTAQMEKKMATLDIPPIPEFIQLLADSGAKLYLCKASVDMFGLEREDFFEDIDSIITVGEFYGLAAGGQIIFT